MAEAAAVSRPVLNGSLPQTHRATKSLLPVMRTRATPVHLWTEAILEGDPHSVIEAMAIAAYAVGADQGYIYIRAEYPIAVNRLNIAIDQARGVRLARQKYI